MKVVFGGNKYNCVVLTRKYFFLHSPALEKILHVFMNVLYTVFTICPEILFQTTESHTFSNLNLVWLLSQEARGTCGIVQ